MCTYIQWTEQQSIVCMYHIFICSSVEAHLGCFHVLAIIHTPVNIGVCVSFQVMFFSGYIPRSEIAGLYGSSYFQFFTGPPYCSPQQLYQFTFPPTVQKRSFLFTLSPAFILCGFFDDSHSGQCEVIAHCSFVFHFSNNQ